MNKKHLYIVVAIVIALYGLYMVYSMYNKPHKIISEQPVDFQISADDLMKEFLTNEGLATSKYLDKIVILEGLLKQISSANGLIVVVLESDNAIVNCEMSPENSHNIDQQNQGEVLFVKGLFIGYDDLLGELQLKKCTIIPMDSKK